MQGDALSLALCDNTGDQKTIELVNQAKKELYEMIRVPSPEEKVQAILDARAALAQYLQSIGKIEVFSNFSKDEICGLIRAAQEGVQESLKKQCDNALNDEIPF